MLNLAHLVDKQPVYEQLDSLTAYFSSTFSAAKQRASLTKTQTKKRYRNLRWKEREGENLTI